MASGWLIANLGMVMGNIGLVLYAYSPLWRKKVVQYIVFYYNDSLKTADKSVSILGKHGHQS